MSKNKNYDSKQIFNTAHSFFLAAQRCAEQRYISEKSIQFLVVPAVVNAAFSCELSIKAILNQCEIPIPRGNDGHKIDSLFVCLPNELQTKVQAEINSAAFHSDLHTISDVFVEWRYLFERSSASISLEFLMALAQTLCKEAEILITESAH